mgnify:CR=1 FL=1
MVSEAVALYHELLADGSVEQYRDIYRQADANLDANDFAVSIETQGYGAGKWSLQQLATIKRLLTWLHTEAGIPLRKIQHWDGSGVGFHAQFGAPSHWTPVAKTCPGPARIKQFDALLVPWMDAYTNPVQPKPATPRPLRVVEHHAFEEEEGKMFPKVRRAFKKDELEDMGTRMEELKQQLMESLAAEEPTKAS